jgi:diacylglycerol kinase
MLIVVIQDVGIDQDMLEHIIVIIDIIVVIIVELIDTIILGDIIK